MSKQHILIQTNEEWHELRKRVEELVAAKVEADFKAFPNATIPIATARVYSQYAATLILDELQPMVRGYISDQLWNK